MANKIKDARFDVTEEVQTEDEAFSSDFDFNDHDPLDAELYTRYKLLQQNSKEDLKHIEQRLAALGRATQSVV